MRTSEELIFPEEFHVLCTNKTAIDVLRYHVVNDYLLKLTGYIVFNYEK